MFVDDSTGWDYYTPDEEEEWEGIETCIFYVFVPVTFAASEAVCSPVFPLITVSARQMYSHSAAEVVGFSTKIHIELYERCVDSSSSVPSSTSLLLLSSRGSP